MENPLQHSILRDGGRKKKVDQDLSKSYRGHCDVWPAIFTQLLLFEKLFVLNVVYICVNIMSNLHRKNVVNF